MSDYEIIRDALNAAQWLTFGTWDTPRCPWCKAKLYYDDGHTKKCKRQAAMEAIDRLERQPSLFGGGDG